MGAGGAMPSPLGKHSDGFFRSSNQRLNAAVATVAHPTADAKPLRLFAQRPAKADTLDPAVYS